MKPSNPELKYCNIGDGFASGPILSAIEDLDQSNVPSETVLRVAGARVVYANYTLLKHDFPQLQEAALEMEHPHLKTLQEAEKQQAICQLIDEWLLQHTAYISQNQANQTLVNTPILVGEERVTAYRPPHYGRALVFSVEENNKGLLQGDGKGLSIYENRLIDVKGTGVAPGVQPRNLLHKNGLYQLGYAFVELVIQHLLQRIFWHSKSNFDTLPIYGILDLGFDELSEEKNHPAGMLIRRAHRRPKKSGGLFAYGSTGQLVQLEAERLLRRYGITSVNSITTIRVWQEDGDLKIRYGEQDIEFLNAKQKAEIIRVSHFKEGMGELKFDGVNLQHTREIGLIPAMATLVDFQTYTVHEHFEYPILSLVSNKLLRWGGSIWPESERFVQPDPALQIPYHLIQASGDIWGYDRGETSKKINSLCFGLAEDFRSNRVDRKTVLETLQRYLNALTAHLADK